MHRLETVASVGKRPAHDGGKRVGEIALLERLAQVDVDRDRRRGRGRRNGFGHRWGLPLSLSRGKPASCRSSSAAARRWKLTRRKAARPQLLLCRKIEWNALIMALFQYFIISTEGLSRSRDHIAVTSVIGELGNLPKLLNSSVLDLEAQEDLHQNAPRQGCSILRHTVSTASVRVRGQAGRASRSEAEISARAALARRCRNSGRTPQICCEVPLANWTVPAAALHQ